MQISLIIQRAKKSIWKTITISLENKKELERIKCELETFHERDFRIDIAVSHILKTYKAMKKLVQDRIKDDKFYKLI